MFESLHGEFSSFKEADFLKEKKTIIPALAELLLKAVKKIDAQKIGIGFSGGVDSALLALLAQEAKKDFTLYTIGLPGSGDLEAAAQCALKMGWPIKLKILSLQEAEAIIENTKEILEEAGTEINQVNLGVGCVVYTILQRAKEDHISTVLGGLGAEEIFAGYMRHCDYGKNLSPLFIQQAMIAGLRDMEIRDLSRDLPLADHFGIELKAPFLDEDLVKYAMKIHPSLKIDTHQKKIILREVAKYLGVPQEPAERKKVAAQYGSGFAKLIKKKMK